VKIGILETNLDAQPARFPALKPCLYAADGAWYADCADGRRLKILQLAVNGIPVAHNSVPPDLAQLGLPQQPLGLG
jgi:hypothetical protein